MEKDRRYMQCQNLILGGFVQSFRDIFEIIPKTRVSRDMRINNLRFTRLINNVDQFVLKDIIRMAALFEIDEELMMKMIHHQYKADKLVN